MFDDINITEILTQHHLPLPGTILYTPADKVEGNELLRYEMRSDGMFAIVEINENLEITWTLEQVRKCTI